jgi:hypothetical protein
MAPGRNSEAPLLVQKNRGIFVQASFLSISLLCRSRLEKRMESMLLVLQSLSSCDDKETLAYAEREVDGFQ